jgi:pimeloyl-ACP methyl ester carboxylesterase
VTVDERPPVLLVPGYLASPPVYGRMAERLLARGAASVTVAPVWTPDWLLSIGRGFGPLVTRTSRAVSRASRQAGGRPLLVIGHSAGGLLARLATSPTPYQGHRGGVAEACGALVTLGTPQAVTEAARQTFRAGFDAIRFLDASVPGAWFAPRTGYVAVGSRCVQGVAATDPDPGRRIAGRLYTLLGGEAARTEWGDGLVVEPASRLDGARIVTLDGIIHAPGLPRPWYGSDEGLDGWWEVAVSAWREALGARRTLVSSAR